MGIIFICLDLEFGVNYILSQYVKNAYYNIFRSEKDGFSIDEARGMIEAAYIASDKEKFLIAVARSFNIEAQNALLKLLEEPPRNITIFLLAVRKAVFLPTVRSRMPIQMIKTERRKNPEEIDFDRLDIKTVYEFTKRCYAMDRERARALIEDTFNYFLSIKSVSAIHQRRFLDAVICGMKLLGLNSTPINALLPILLILLECKNGTEVKRR
ncbi:MAG: hypothetical protein LBN32_03540 [Helicobacteraceae bacterium]|jgi:DNA polymerase-3 subunit delta'|nr:hypothetical protein [Helicobacteraceae bacterium]